MMKGLITIIVLFWVANATIAQGRLHVNTGLTHAAFTPEIPTVGMLSPPEISNTSNWFIGVNYEIDLPGKLTLNPGLQFARVSTNSRSAIQIKSINNWLSLPLLLNYHFNDRFSFNGGVQYNYLASAVLRGDVRDNVTEDQKRSDAGIVLGSTVKVIGRFSVDIRYVFGIVDLQDPIFVPLDPNQPNLIGTVDYDSYNRYFQLGIQYQLFGKGN